MELEAVLLSIVIFLLTIITAILLGIVFFVYKMRKKMEFLKMLKYAKFGGGPMALLPLLKFVLSRRNQSGR